MANFDYYVQDENYVVRGDFVSERFGFVMVTEPLAKPCCQNTSLLNKFST
jgi:hypothetical protein